MCRAYVSIKKKRTHRHLTHLPLQGPRRRRSSSAEYKAQLVEQCLLPQVSIASIALANGLNANLLRRWLAQYKAPQQ